MLGCLDTCFLLSSVTGGLGGWRKRGDRRRMEGGIEGGQQQSPQGYEPAEVRQLEKKWGERGETEGDGDGCQSVTLSVLVTIPPHLSISSLSHSVFRPLVYSVAPYMPLENNIASAVGLYICLNY